MCNIELLQFLQIFISVLFIIGITYYVTFSITNYVREDSASFVGRILFVLQRYSVKLTVRNYEAFHKYDIWRYYLLSDNR